MSCTLRVRVVLALNSAPLMAEWKCVRPEGEVVVQVKVCDFGTARLRLKPKPSPNNFFRETILLAAAERKGNK